MLLLAGTEKFNLTRYTGQQRFYENYSLRFADPRQQVALWYRQSVRIAAGEDPEAILWFSLFDLASPDKSRHWKKTSPLEAARIEKDIHYFAVGGGELYHKGTHGETIFDDVPVKWQLTWTPAERAYRHLPRMITHRLPFPPVKIIAPNPDIQVTGELQVGEKSYHFDAVPGHQGHSWGPHLAEGWVWGQVNLFDGERRAYFEGLSGSLRWQGRTFPPLTVLRLHVDDKEYLFNQPWQWRNNTSNPHLDRWHFEGGGRRHRIVGDVFVHAAHLMGVTLTDTDGSKVYVYHTENAQLKVQLHTRRKGRWMLEHELLSQPAMAYEYATREPVSGVPLKF